MNKKTLEAMEGKHHDKMPKYSRKRLKEESRKEVDDEIGNQSGRGRRRQ